jgi:hypothetical protein
MSETRSANEFHAHLDVCRRCREEPFNLCTTGLRLALKQAIKFNEALKEQAHG